MAITQEMFRFVTTRRPDRAMMHRINGRLIRDRRAATPASLLVKLFGPGDYEPKLAIANSYANSADFLAANDAGILALEPAVDFFRSELATGADLATLASGFAAALPTAAALLLATPPADVLEATSWFTGRLWDSFYAQTVRGCDRYVSTNYLADGLRVFHVLRLLWLSSKAGRTTWGGWCIR